MTTEAPCLIGLQFREPDFKCPDEFPFGLPWLAEFELSFNTSVTFFVGVSLSSRRIRRFC